MILVFKKKSLSFFHLMFLINALIYGLVYFFPKNGGEPYIPPFLKLFFDLIVISSFFIYGLKKKISYPQSIYLIYLLFILTIGFIHILNYRVSDFLHYSFRNVFFYGFILFIDYFKLGEKNFNSFHEKVFLFVLYFGFGLFTLKVLGIKNPFAFGAWFWEKNRLISTFLNPNSLGFYMMFYLIYFYFKKSKVSVITFLIIGTIFLSGSLTAVLGVFFFIGYLIIKILSNIKFKQKYLLLSALSIPFLIYGFIYFGILEYFFFKINVLFVQKSKIHTSVSARVQNIYSLIEYFKLNNFFSIILGDFKADKYVRLDSQYLNIFYNYGFFVLLIFIYFLITLQNLLKTNKKNILFKTFYLFNIWLFLFGFNLTAYIYRVNVIVFYFMMLNFALYQNKLHDKKYTE
jgi:hypothetical protein